jgi:DNA-binding NarL/FixJ family response regulator
MIELSSILVIDDDPVSSMLIFEILKKRCKTILVLSNIEEALEWVNANQPDIILLDILMPKVSGYDVCLQLKTKKNTCHIPIIFLSSLANANDKVHGFEVGGSDFITKPYYPEEVVARIESCLKIHKQLALASEKTEKCVTNLYGLNEREIKVLNLCANGYKVKQMAAELYVTEHAIKWNLKNIYTKLEVSSRLEAVKIANEIGCID